MDDARRRQPEDFQERLEELQATDRARARQRMQTAPHELSDYETRLLGADYLTHRRQQAAAQQAAQETAERATRQREAVTVALCPAGIVFRNSLHASLNAHSVDLAVRYGITVTRSHDDGAWGSQELKRICAPAVTSEETYAVFLHEVGHVVDPAADSRQYRYFIEDSRIYASGGELGAWTWAFTNALVWTLPMFERLCRSLQHHPAFRSAPTPDALAAMTDCISRARARVSGAGALPPWRQRSYEPGAHVVYNKYAWAANVYMHKEAEWPAPGENPVCWRKA